jgi:hypothetical protein
LRHICNFCGLLKQLCVLYNPIFSAEPCFGSTAVNIPCLGGTVSRGMAVPSPNFGARGGGCSTPQRGCFTAGKEPPYPIYRRLAGPQGLCGRVWRRKGLFSPPGVEQKVMITLILGIIVWRGCFEKLSYQSTTTTTTTTTIQLDRINVYGSRFIQLSTEYWKQLQIFREVCLRCLLSNTLLPRVLQKIVNSLLKGAYSFKEILSYFLCLPGTMSSIKNSVVY